MAGKECEPEIADEDEDTLKELGYTVMAREAPVDKPPHRHGHLPNLDETERGLRRSKY
jgi:hypothetical protein